MVGTTTLKGLYISSTSETTHVLSVTIRYFLKLPMSTILVIRRRYLNRKRAERTLRKTSEDRTPMYVPWRKREISGTGYMFMGTLAGHEEENTANEKCADPLLTNRLMI